MLEICLCFSKSEPQYAYKRYTWKKMYGGPLTSFGYRNSNIDTQNVA